MPYATTLRALIAEKEAEIARAEAELAAARTYVTVLQRHIAEAESGTSESADSVDPVIAIRRVIRQAGHPMFIDDIVRGLDRPVTRDSREDVRRLVLPWVRRGEIFSRPRPLTYGLVELDESN